MNLFLVVSDSHGNLTHAAEAIKMFPQITAILHLGDHVRDAARLASKFPAVKVLAVAGNCDFEADTDLYPLERILEFDGKRIFMTHGHKYSVKSGLGKLLVKSEKNNLDLILFGHTHIPADVFRNDRHLLNPGSIALPKDGGRPTFALVEIGRGLIECRIIEL